MRNKYHNYDPHPVKKIGGHDSEIWENYGPAAEKLRKEAEKRKKQGRVLVVFDLYPGVRKEEVLKLAASLGADHILDMESCRKSEEERLKEFEDYITDDRVFGILCHKKLKDFYDSEKLEAMKKEVEGRFSDYVTKGQLKLHVAYTTDEETAKQWKEEVQNMFPDIAITRMDPLSFSVTCHTGPGVLAIAASHALDVTE